MKLPHNLIFKQFEIGPMGNFSYFIGDASTKEIAVVDPGWQAQDISKMAKQEGFIIKAILLTHGHYDHAQATADLLKLHKVPVYVNSNESFNLPGIKIKHVSDGDRISIGSIQIDCIHTPGHTPGGMCYHYENILLTGDTLFIDAIGRCDLPGSSAKHMKESLNKICRLPDDTIIFSGHGYGPSNFDTLGNQKNTNPYLNGEEW